jgi:hypothetical protein
VLPVLPVLTVPLGLLALPGLLVPLGPLALPGLLAHRGRRVMRALAVSSPSQAERHPATSSSR